MTSRVDFSRPTPTTDSNRKLSEPGPPLDADKINLTFMDADAGTNKDQDFAFIGDDRSSGRAGELRYDSRLLWGDVTGDGSSDFRIEFANGAEVTEDSFILSPRHSPPTARDACSLRSHDHPVRYRPCRLISPPASIMHGGSAAARGDPTMKTSLACLVALFAGPAAAQQSTDWSFAGSIYGWLPALSTSIDTNSRAGTVETDLSITDAIDTLDFAFMGTLEARKGPVTFLGDLIYTDLSISERSPRGLIFDKSTVDTKLTMFSGYGLYSVRETEMVDFSVGAGFRVYSMDVDLGLQGGLLDGRKFGGSESWVDPLVVARLVVPFSEKWFATAFGDIGGFGIGDASELTYQALVSVGYRLNDRWSTQFAYRYLNIEKDVNGDDTTLELYGPVIGATYRF